MSQFVVPADAQGLGNQPAAPIVALPPLDEIRPALPIDPATGEPPHGDTLPVAFGLFLVAAAAQSVTLGLAWWRAIHMDTFPTAVRLLKWTNPSPGSFASIALAVAMMAIGVVLVAAPALAGYLGWVGRPAAPWWGIGVVALTAATLCVTPDNWSIRWGNTGWLAVPLCIAATILLFLPQSRRLLRNWQTFRDSARTPRPTVPVRYGRAEQFR